MVTREFVKSLVVFSLISIALGIGSALSPTVASLGWAIGTAISTAGGLFYGLRAHDRAKAMGGGALVGGVSIAVGCALAFALGALPIEGVLAAATVGAVSGAVAGLVARSARGARSARAA